MAEMGPILWVIDGHAQIFRAYYAIRGGMSSAVTGEPTQAAFAFAGMLLKFFNSFQPRYAVMAIDTPGKTFRDELYPAYKANRPPPPPDFHGQERRIFEMTRLFGIPILGLSGAEADDLIATIVERVVRDDRWADFTVRLVSRDKDLEQLLGPRVCLFDIHTDTLIDPRRLEQDKGIRPDQVVDVLALMGDSVDNVPGVPGIGPKTAAELIGRYGTLENVLANVGQLTGKRRENIEKSKDLLALSRRLVTLKRDLDVDCSPGKFRVGPMDGSALRHLFEELGFRRHMHELDRLLRAAGPPSAAPAPAAPQALVFAPSLYAASAPDAAPAAAAADPAQTVRLADLSGRDYRAVTTREQLAGLVGELQGQRLVALDTETIGLGHRAELCGISLAWTAGRATYIPVRSPQPQQHLDAAAVIEALRPVLQNPEIGKCGHNLKYDALVLAHAGAPVRGLDFDSMIASHLLGLPAHGLDDLALRLLDHRMIPITQLIGQDDGPGPLLGGGRRTMDQAPLDLITRYACDDAEVSWRLRGVLEPQLRLLGMEDLSRQVEMPLVEVLADMEFAGVRVDPAVLEQQKRSLATRIEELRRRIHEAAGGAFNIDSPRQLGEVLFQRMGLPVLKRTKTAPSTDVEVLDRLAEHEQVTREQAAVLVLIQEYRQLTKLVSTYLDALRDSIDPRTGRVHAQFHQTGAATGRLSSSDPNLQNIPIRTEVGRQVRRAFVAAPGQVLICADYSQIELRILAHLSSDPALIDAFQRGQDIHSAVAAQVFNVPPQQVTREMRGHAKVINFGIVYGVTPYGLARRIDGMTVDAARQLIGDYKRRFAGIGVFLDRCVHQAEELGYVTTIMGRRRPIAQIRSSNASARALGGRLAINSVVQGSAADLIKLAMVNLRRRILRERLPARILLQIHDELVLESEQGAADAVRQTVVQEMETALRLRVPLGVDAGVGPDWLAAKGD